MVIYFKDLDKKTQDAYDWLDENSRRYPLQVLHGVLRFKGNRAVRFASFDLNAMWLEAQRNEWPVEEMMEFYRMLGYSLCGFSEIFTDELIKQGHC